jgi:hypothetical protein
MGPDAALHAVVTGLDPRSTFIGSHQWKCADNLGGRGVEMAMQGLSTTVLGALAAAALSFVLAPTASATVYTLDNVTFDDGQTANGFFSTDVDGFVDAIDITTTTGSIAGFHYTQNINPEYNPGDSTITFERAGPGDENPPADDGFLQLTFSHAIDGASPNALITGEEGPSLECDSFTCPTDPGSVERFVASGSITSVPEPGTWALMTIGLFGIGYGIRTSRRRTTSDSRLARARSA